MCLVLQKLLWSLTSGVDVVFEVVRLKCYSKANTFGCFVYILFRCLCVALDGNALPLLKNRFKILFRSLGAANRWFLLVVSLICCIMLYLLE